MLLIQKNGDVLEKQRALPRLFQTVSGTISFVKERHIMNAAGILTFALPSTTYILGLDIGHGFSGYAFTTRSAFGEVHLNNNWATGFTAHKTPTALLLRREQCVTCLAFGYEAYEEYSRLLSESEDSKDVMLYHHFKDFYGPETEKRRLDCVPCKNHDATFCSLKDETEFCLIYEHIVNYLKQHACKRIEEITNTKVSPNEVLWVLTLSSWENAEHISKALNKAGLDGVRVQRKLGHVTNSALYHCLKVDKFPHSCCVVINLGANASHMVLYQNTNSGAVLSWKEVASAWCSGSDRIKHRLIHTVAECCGWDFVSSYTKKYPSLWLDLLNNLEQGFSAVTSKSHLLCELTNAFGEEFEEAGPQSNMSLREAFQKTLEKDGVLKKSGLSISKTGKLVIAKERLHNLCEPVFQELEKTWIQLYNSGQRSGAEPEAVYLVGGLTANELVRERMRLIVGDNVRLVIPEQPETCAAKGAVVVGTKFLQ